VKVWRTSLPSLLSEFSQAEHTVREEVLSQAFADPIGFLRKSDAPELAKCSLGVQGEEAGARGRSVPFVRWQLCKLQQAAPGIAQEASVLAVPPCTPRTPNEHLARFNGSRHVHKAKCPQNLSRRHYSHMETPNQRWPAFDWSWHKRPAGKRVQPSLS
jgi:hypothetical protein